MWTQAEAAEALKSMVAPFHVAYEAEDQAKAARDFEKLKAACVRIVKLDDAFIAQLKAGRWAPELRDEVDGVIRWAEADRVGVENCALHSPNFDFAAALIAKAHAENEYNGSMAKLWDAVGLPPVQ